MATDITYFVHGTTTDNQAGLATGWLPGKLSKEGKHQARHLGEQVANTFFDVLFCSDLQRAVDSAELGFGNRSSYCPIIQDSRLRECNYGDFSGQLAVLFKDDLSKYVETAFPNGENYHDVEKRMVDFIDYLRQEYLNKQIAVVAHQAPQLALDVLLRGRTWQQAIDEDWRKKGEWQPGWRYII